MISRAWFAVICHADGLGHKLHLPGPLQEPLCFLLDLACGIPLRVLIAERRGRGD